ncbi:MAG: PKD domain-containing protein [Caldilinea sp.]
MTHVNRRRLLHGMGVGVTALTALMLLAVLMVWSSRSASAQNGASGSASLTTVADFGGACAALPGIIPQPTLSDAIVSSANGGEIRLRATVEDYFDGPTIDETQWITGAANADDYPEERPLLVSGVVSMTGGYLRSQSVITNVTTPRFFEASTRFAEAGAPNYSDIGFYRSQPPLGVSPLEDTSIRLFVSQPFESAEQPRLLFARTRDGDSNQPLLDTIVDNWGSDTNSQLVALSNFNRYRIEWDATNTWYFIDGAVIMTATEGASQPLPHAGTTTRDTYVFLMAQDQGWSPLQVDWVRAGQYPAQGVYTSCVQDAGQIANWPQMTVTATVPVDTGALAETRTSVDGVTWSSWTAVSGSIASGQNLLTPASPSGRYWQARFTLTSSDPLNSPEIGALDIAYFGPTSLALAPPSATLNPGAAQPFVATVRDGNNAIVVGAPVTWTVVNGGGVLDAGGRFTAGLLAGVYTDTVLAATLNNASNRATIVVLDLPPIASAGGPYSGQEGQPVTLDASASLDPNGGVLTYAWDLDNDGQYDDATGVAPTASWGDEGVYTIGVLVTDAGGLTDTDSTTVSITNRAPQLISITNTSPVRRGQPVTVTVDAVDVPADALSYSFDWNSDGNFEIADQAANFATTALAATGLHTATVRVSDGDGGVVTGTTTITVTPQNLTIQAVTNDGPVRRNQPVTVIVTATQELTDALRYAFDWENDGNYEVVDQSSNSAATSFATTGPKTVGVRVTDADGGVAMSTTAITVTPQLLAITDVADTGPVRRGQLLTVTVSAAQELTDTLVYGFDFDADGAFEIVQPADNRAVTSYLSTGAKSIGVGVADADAAVVTATTTITVTPQLMAIASITNDGPVLRNQPVMVTVTATQELTDTLRYAFDWENDGNFDTPDQPANSASTSYPTIGAKTVGVRVSDVDGGVVTGTTTITVSAQLLQISAIHHDAPQRRGQAVTVAVDVLQQLGEPLFYSFDWTGDGVYDVVDQSANTASTTYLTTGLKTVRVRVRDNFASAASSETTLSITPQNLTIASVANDGPVLRNQPVTVSVAATQELSDVLRYAFDWDNDGNFDTPDQPANSATTSYATVGAKTVGVRVRDADGGAVYGSTTVEVITQTLRIVAINSDAPTRRGQPVTVSVDAVQQLAEALLYSFDWNNDGTYEVENQSSNQATTSYAATGEKSVGVRVVAADGAVATGATTITVTPQNLTIAAVTNSGPVKVGDSVQVTVNAAQELSDVLLYSFDWNDDGTYEVVDQPANSAATSYAETGAKTVRVRVQDADGGVATSTTSIQVDDVGGSDGADMIYLPLIHK